MELIIDTEHTTFDTYLACLTSHTPFALSRFGDGEWGCILGRPGQTCDGQAYTSALMRDLSQALKDRPSYLLGLQPLAVRRYGAMISAWLRMQQLWPRWVSSDVWHHASIHGRLGELLDVLRSRVVVMVGPERLRPVGQILPIRQYVETPQHNAHADLKGIRYRLAKSLARVGDDVVVLLCCGPTANVIVHDYFGPRPQAAKTGLTMIDFGAVFEPYLGIQARSYHPSIIERLAQS